MPQPYIFSIVVIPPFMSTVALFSVLCDVFTSRDPRNNELNVPSYTIQYNAMQCSAMQCGAVRCDAMRCDAMRCNVIKCDAMRCDAMRCDAMRWDEMRCDAMRRDATQRNDIVTCGRAYSFTDGTGYWTLFALSYWLLGLILWGPQPAAYL